MALLQSASRVVVSSLIVAVGAAASIQALSQWAAQSAETESRLIELQSTLNAMNALEWRAISLRSLDEETTEAFEHERTRASTLLAATNAAGADANGELADGYERYAGAIARELTMIDQGRIDEALELDEAEVDPAFEHLAEGAEGGETFCNPGPCCANVVRLPRGNRSPFKCVRLTPHVDVLEFRPRRNRGTVLSRAAQMVATIASQGVTFTGAPESGGRIAWTQIRSVGMLADGVVIETDDDWIVLFGVNPLLWAHLVADAGQSLVD